MFTAFQNGLLDFFVERSASRWAKKYDFPSIINGDIKKGYFKTNGCINQGIYFNLRNKSLQNVKLREAITKIFDFEWANKNLFYGEYIRSLSYFPGSIFNSESTPKELEKKILSKYKNELPKELFNKTFLLKSSTKAILNLLTSAGFFVKDQKMINKITNKQLKLTLLTPKGTEKVAIYFKDCLKRYGIELKIISPDSTIFIKKINEFDFDLLMTAYAQSLTPGNELSCLFSSKSAYEKGSINYSGINNKVVDSIIGKIKQSKSYEELIQTVRALDRVLLWNYYMIPLWYFNKIRIAYKNTLEFPHKLEHMNLSYHNPILNWNLKNKPNVNIEENKENSFFKKIWIWICEKLSL